MMLMLLNIMYLINKLIKIGMGEIMVILETERLFLKSSSLDFTDDLLKYYLRNKDFLEQFEMKREKEFYTFEHQYQAMKFELYQQIRKVSFRFYIYAKCNPNEIIGVIAVNNIIWGCSLSAYLGYRLDYAHANQGYITEAVKRVEEFAFGDLKLHRLEANVKPNNFASLRVLEKCGYENEGCSKQYLKINGVWEDRIHMVKLNNEV